MSFPEHPFWDFSLQVYGTGGVAPACLALQDRHGVDVNVLMFCLWLGATGYEPRDEAAMRRVCDRVATWHDEIVRRLRSVRKRMKEEIKPVDYKLAQAIRARLQKVEIDTEHLEQLTLADAVRQEKPSLEDGAARADAAGRNVAAYFEVLGITLDDADDEALETLFGAAFPEYRETAASALRS